MNRLRIIQVGYTFFEEFLLLREFAPCRHSATIANIPDDMEIVSVRDKPFGRCFEVLVRSVSFDEITEGATPPTWQLIYSVKEGE